MDDMLAKILEMDKVSRKQAEEAEEAKRKAFDELSFIRTSLIESKLADAQKTVAELYEREFQEASKTTAGLRMKNEAAREKLNAVYIKNNEKWIDDIYNSVLK